MKFSIVALLIFIQIRCGSFAKLQFKENQTDANQQRSARVHRVADYEFPKDDDSRIKNTIKDVMIKQAVLLGSQELEKLLVDFPNLNNLVQHEAQLFKELNMILMELVRDGTVTLRNIDFAISEIKDTSTSSTPIKSLLNNDNSLKSLLNSLEELDIYQQNDQVNENQRNSRISASRMETMNELELKTVKNIAQTLDNVLMKIQNHITFVRSVFHRLCRKHHSMVSTQSNASNPEKFTSMNQPKKVSIL